MRHPISDLKNAASTTLFKGWSVTPQMKEQVRKRIKRIEAGEEPAPAQRSRAPIWALGGVAAACAVTIIGLQTAGLPFTAGPEAPPPPAYTTEGESGEQLKLSDKVMDRDALSNGATVVINSSDSRTARDESGFAAVPNTAPIPVVEAQPGQKIVRNAEFTLKVTDARAAMEQLQRMAANLGGYVADAVMQQAWEGGYTGRVVLRIPAEQYAPAVGSLKAYGEVSQERQWTQDVTSQFMDMENRLRTLEEFESQLRGLAANAANFDDWLKLSRQINETRVEIDNLQGRLKLLANQIDFSTISISLAQVSALVEPAGAGLGARTSIAFQRSLLRMGQLSQAGIVGTAAALPFAAPAGLVGAIAWMALRRRRRE